MSRLRVAELLAAGAAVVLLVALLILHWESDPGRIGWAAVPVLRWPLLLLAALGLILTVAQAAMRGPALAVTLDLVTGPFGAVVTILLALRLASTGATLTAGAYVGVVAAAALTAASFWALRIERGWTPGVDREVELVPLPSPPSD